MTHARIRVSSPYLLLGSCEEADRGREEGGRQERPPHQGEAGQGGVVRL